MKSVEELIEAKARSGDGAHVIAYALLQIAHAQAETAAAVQRLGNGDAATHMGAIENLSMQVTKVAEAIVELSAR